jgi:hypothetical protein
MTKEFVPHDRSLKLKELEFDEPCFSIWKNDKLISVGGHWGMNITHSMFGFEGDMFALDECRAPTFSQAFRWFREEYGLFVSPNVISYGDGPYLWFFEINSTVLPFGTDLGETDDYKTYEEAELACLDKLIEIIETKLK